MAASQTELILRQCLVETGVQYNCDNFWIATRFNPLVLFTAIPKLAMLFGRPPVTESADKGR